MRSYLHVGKDTWRQLELALIIWMLVSYFYEGMSPQMKQLLETMCGGDFMNKSLDDAFQFLNYVADVSKSWEDPIIKQQQRFKGVNKVTAIGMYALPKGLDI